MQKTIWKNTFDVKDEVMMRQMMEIWKLHKKHEAWELDEMDLSVEVIVIMTNKINDNEDKKSFKDFILDNLTDDKFAELSEFVMNIVEKFLKKKETMNTNMKSSWINETENSVTNGEKS